MRFLVLLLLAFRCYAEDLTAKSWLIADQNGKIIDSEHADHVRPIASITKLLTAIVILESGVDMSEDIDTQEFGSISRHELLNMAMVRSNNPASILLCDSYPGGYKSCIRRMNEKLQELGMTKSKVYDPSGLDPRNKSTAEELIKLVKESSKYPEIIAASSKSSVEVKIRKKWIFFKNTNPLIGTRQDILVSKTGWTRRAGGCLVMYLSTDRGYRTVVVLGSLNTHTRVPEAEFIAQNYQ
jgi:D-alanyl-D-alanine carboxypeptidase